MIEASGRSRASGNSRRQWRELPRPPIEAVLKELTGIEEVPTCFGWLRLRCPFHEDRTPSAAVNHERGGFACHSCGRQGDALKLLQNELGLSFKEAVEKAKTLGESGEGDSRRMSRKRRASDLLGGG